MSNTNVDSGASDIPWKPPVIAAIVGALVVAAFVIYAIVNGPTDPPESDSLFTQPVPSVDIPPGYVLLDRNGDVGIKVESVTRDSGSSIVVVSSAVAGTTDPSDSPPPDVAYWEMGPEGARVMMESQFASDGAVGTTTIVVPAEITEPGIAVVAHPTAALASAGMKIEVSPDMIGEPVVFALEVESGLVISGHVTVGDGWGTVEWVSPHGMVATLDVEVTFTGTENAAADVLEPMRLVPVYDPLLARPGTVIIPRPLFGFGGSYGLYGDGRSLTDAGTVTSIVIDLNGAVVSETAEAVILNLASDEG
jgi:hypothetical protein